MKFGGRGGLSQCVEGRGKLIAGGRSKNSFSVTSINHWLKINEDKTQNLLCTLKSGLLEEEASGEADGFLDKSEAMLEPAHC